MRKKRTRWIAGAVAFALVFGMVFATDTAFSRVEAGNVADRQESESVAEDFADGTLMTEGEDAGFAEGGDENPAGENETAETADGADVAADAETTDAKNEQTEPTAESADVPEDQPAQTVTAQNIPEAVQAPLVAGTPADNLDDLITEIRTLSADVMEIDSVYTDETSGVEIGNVTIKINGSELTDSTELYEGESVTISFRYNLPDEENKDDVTTYKTEYSVDCANLMQGITLQATSGSIDKGSETVCDYEVSAESIKLILCQGTEFIQEDNRFVELTVQGTVTESDDITADGTSRKISFADQEYNPIVYKTSGDSEAGVAKQADGKVTVSQEDGNVSYAQNFTVTVKANTGKITLTDDLEDYLYYNTTGNRSEDTTLSDWTIMAVDTNGEYSITQVIDDSVTTITTATSIDGLSDLVGVVLYQGQSITISYTMSTTDPLFYQERIYTNLIHVGYQTNRGTATYKEGTAAVNCEKPTVSKSGKEVTEGEGDAEKTYVEWTITIDPKDLSSVITDADGLERWFGTIKDSMKDTTYVEDSDGDDNDISWASFVQDQDGVWTCTYKTQLNTEYLPTVKDTTIENTVIIDSEILGSYTVSGSYVWKAIYGAPGLTKTKTSEDEVPDANNGVDLTWQVVISGLQADYNYLVLYDTPRGDGHEVTGITVKVGEESVIILTDGGATEEGKDVATWAGNALTFKKSWLEENPGTNATEGIAPDITVTFTTHIDNVDANTRYYNGAYIAYGYQYEENGQTDLHDTTSLNNNAQAYYEHPEASDLVRKTGNQNGSANEIKYTLTVNLKNLTTWNYSASQDIVLTDTLPDGLTFVENSVVTSLEAGDGKYYQNGETITRNESSETVSLSTQTKQDETNPQAITFTVTIGDNLKNIIDLTNDKSNDDGVDVTLYVEFTAKITDIDAMDEAAKSSNKTWETAYENTVEGWYNSTEIGDNKISTAVSVHDNRVTKNVDTYTNQTAPYASFTVKINQDALTLNGGEPLTATDTIGRDMQFIDVLDEEADISDSVRGKYGITVTGADSVTYTVSGSTITFSGIPDATPVTITYWVQILTDEGTNFKTAGADVSNTFALSGVGGDFTCDLSDSYDSALEIWNKAGSTVTSITLKKTGDGDPVDESTEGLGASVFDVYRVTYSDGKVTNKKTKLLHEGITLSESDGAYTATIGNLASYNLYAIYETAAGSDYACNIAPVYFAVNTEDSYYSGMDVTYLYTEGNEFDKETAATLTYTNSLAATLIITETFEGLSADDAAYMAQFCCYRIYYTDDEGEEYLVAQFSLTPGEYDGYSIEYDDNGIYTISMYSLPAGSYTIVKEVEAVEGFDFDGLTDSGNTSGNGGGTSGSWEAIYDESTGAIVAYRFTGGTVSLTAGGTTTEAETTPYSPTYGKLLITKTIEGDVTKEEAEGRLKFTVTNESNTEQTYSYTLKNFTYDDNTGLYTKRLAMTAGTYTVEESVYDVSGYRCSVSYTLGGGADDTGKDSGSVGAQKGSAADSVTVTQSEDALSWSENSNSDSADAGGQSDGGDSSGDAQLTVAFTDSYTKSAGAGVGGAGVVDGDDSADDTDTAEDAIDTETEREGNGSADVNTADNAQSDDAVADKNAHKNNKKNNAKIKENADNSTTVADANANRQEADESTNGPQTGDDAPILLCFVLLFTSGFGSAGLIVTRKKHFVRRKS